MIGKSVKGVPERQYSELAWDNKQSAAIKLGKSSRTDREPVTRMSDIPWVLVVDEMVLNITAGAVIQHLAKFRTRMVEQGLSVPPPLGSLMAAVVMQSKSTETRTQMVNILWQAPPTVVPSAQRRRLFLNSVALAEQVDQLQIHEPRPPVNKLAEEVHCAQDNRRNEGS